MTTVLVDSATIHQVVQCLDRGMANQYPWSLSAIIELTALLMREDSMAIAPGLMVPRSVVLDSQEFLFDIMIDHGLLSALSPFDKNTVDSATYRSKRWIGRTTNIEAVRTEVESLMADKTNFQNWIDWAAPNAWQPHSQRFGGLFGTIYLPYVARILDISVEEALRLHNRSMNPKELSHLVAVRNQDFEQMTRAYVASAIIRGRYHEEVSRHDGLHLVRHPLRGMISKTRTGRRIEEIRVPPVAAFLACIVIYGAVKQRRLKDRLRCWVDNTRNVHRLLKRSGVQLVGGTGYAAADMALSLAKHAHVQVVDSRWDTVLEVAAGLGLGALTTIYLNPWLGVPIGATTSAGLRKLGLPGRARNAIVYYVKGQKLKQLAAGRIETEWSKTDNYE
jgi:hypothetical protein